MQHSVREILTFKFHRNKYLSPLKKHKSVKIEKRIQESMAFPWWPLVGPLQGGAASRRPGCLPELHCSWDKPPPVRGSEWGLFNTAGTGWWSATGKSFGILTVQEATCTAVRWVVDGKVGPWGHSSSFWHFCTAASIGQQYLTRPKIPKS